MKKVFYYLFGVMCLCLFNACSDDDKGPGVPPPSKGEEAVEKVVTVLEEHTEVSDFVEVLKKANVSDVTTEELTVFAVRNAGSALTRSGAGVLDTVSVKRHIALGSYRKADLTDGKELTSASGDKLYIAREGDDVYVNGVQIEGDEIPAGNSYVYVVPEVIEEKEQPVPVYTSTLYVQAVSAKAAPFPLEGVAITVWPAEEGDTLGTWLTDAEGKIEVKHTCSSIAYKVYKEGYSYEQDGFLLGLDADGNLIQVDLNGDGVIDNGNNTLGNHGDLKVIGNSNPRFRFGLTLGANWKGFDVQMFFQGVMKRDLWVSGPLFWGGDGGEWQSTGLKQHLDYFRPENTSSVFGPNVDSYYPKAYIGDKGNKNKYTQTRYLQNAAYMRMKNLQIGYTFPQEWTNKLHVDRLRVFFSGENLFTLTGIAGMFDPEATAANGWSSGKTYPLSQTFSFGLNLTL